MATQWHPFSLGKSDAEYPHLTCKHIDAGSAARKENVRPANGVHRPPDSNGHSKGPEPEPCTLAEVAEPALVRDVLCACQVRIPFQCLPTWP